MGAGRAVGRGTLAAVVGGLAGTISYSAMAPVVQQGFAAASTDTGHVPTEPQTWLLSRERITWV